MNIGLKKKGTRLIVVIPVILPIFSLASAVLTLRLVFPSSHSITPATTILTWVILMSIFAFITGTILALAIVRPINRMVKQTESILYKDEALHQRTNMGTEIESLASMFEKLVSSIDKYVSTDERQRAELVKNRIQQIEYLADLGAFSLGLAHEIKNPLGYLRGLTELIGRDLSDDDPKRAYVRTIINGIDRLDSITEEVLALARIEQMELELKPVKIEEILGEALAISEHKYAGKKIHVHQSYDKNLQEVSGNHEKLVQVFSNIIINAFEATPEDGTITISTESMIPSVLLIHIKNTGSYIPPEEREKLFQPFFTKKKNGIGLGLFITKHIIIALSGTIGVESDPLTGTVFSVRLQKTL